MANSELVGQWKVWLNWGQFTVNYKKLPPWSTVWRSALRTFYLRAPSWRTLQHLAVCVSLFVTLTLSKCIKCGTEMQVWACDVLLLCWASWEGPKQTLNQLSVVNIQNSEGRPKKHLMTAIHRILPTWQQEGLLLQQGMAASRPAGVRMFLTQWNFRSVVAENLFFCHSLLYTASLHWNFPFQSIMEPIPTCFIKGLNTVSS